MRPSIKAELQARAAVLWGTNAGLSARNLAC